MEQKLIEVRRYSEELIPTDKSLVDVLSANTPCVVDRRVFTGPENYSIRAFALNYLGLMMPYDGAIYWTIMVDHEKDLLCKIFPSDSEIVVVSYSRDSLAPHFRGRAKLAMDYPSYYYDMPIIDALLEFREAGYRINKGRQPTLAERAELSKSGLPREKTNHIVTQTDLTNEQLADLRWERHSRKA